MAALTDVDPKTRGVRVSVPLVAFLVLASGGCRGSNSTRDLIEMAKSKDSADRARAVQALGERRAEADVVVPILVEAMKDKDAFVRRDAARGLGRLGPAAAAAIDAIRTGMRDKNQHVRQAAAEALRKVAPDLPPEPVKR
jgi:HEAT repeat protein